MNKSQEFYIRQHFGKKAVKELSEDTGMKLSDVKKFVKTLNVVKETPKTLFASHENGAVAMTAAQSEVDDKIKYPPKPKLNCVFVMDPNKPVR